MRLGADADFGTFGVVFEVPDEVTGLAMGDFIAAWLLGLEGRGSWSSALRLVPPTKFALVAPLDGACRVELDEPALSFFGVEDEAGGAGGRESGGWGVVVDPRDERTESRKLILS